MTRKDFRGHSPGVDVVGGPAEKSRRRAANRALRTPSPAGGTGRPVPSQPPPTTSQASCTACGTVTSTPKNVALPAQVSA